MRRGWTTQVVDVPAELASLVGLMMVTGPGVQVRLLDVEKQTYIDSDSGFQWGPAAFAPDGSQYAVAEEGRIRLWDGRTGEYQGSLDLTSATRHAIWQESDAASQSA